RMRGALRNPLFILGYPRSGTTLLRALLGAHPQIHLVNEPELIRGIRTAGFGIHDHVAQEGRSRLLRVLNTIGLCRRHLSTLPPETLDRFLADQKDLSFKELYECLLPKPDEVTIWGEKSLSNIFHIHELVQLYPNALFVHVVRNPQATLHSY